MVLLAFTFRRIHEQVDANHSRRQSRGHLTEPLIERRRSIKAEVASAEPIVPSLKRAATSLSVHIPRKRKNMGEALTDSLSKPPTYGLRLRSEPQTPVTLEERPGRSARRAKPVQSIEKSERFGDPTTFDLSHSHINYADATSDDEDGMTSDRDGETFTKEETLAFPGESFHHTGNGYYRRGQPSVKPGKMAKTPKTEERRADGIRSFDGQLVIYPNESVKRPERDRFYGREFHHAGNGYFRYGPCPKGTRTSHRVTFPRALEHLTERWENETELEDTDGTVTKRYRDLHTEFEWFHRGNSRYQRKVALASEAAASTSASLTPAATLTRRTSNNTNTSNGNEQHSIHTRRSINSGSRRTTLNEEASDTPLGLVTREQAQRSKEHIHRGQGRSAKRTPTESTSLLEEEMGTGDSLFDTQYVDSHPEETFHHRGQGRWARGLPSTSASHKTAVRGPGAKDWVPSQRLSVDNEAIKGLPALTALVTKAEGPEIFGYDLFTYRGGGKWGRISKEKFDDHTKSTKTQKAANYSNYKPKGKRRDSQAQVEDEQSANDEDGVDQESEEEEPEERIAPKKQKPKFSRTAARKSAPQNLPLRQPSDAQSSATAPPPPPPRMLTAEEDTLTEADLPSLYADDDDDDASNASLEGIDPRVLAASSFRPLNTEAIIASLTKFDPATRSLANLKAVAENAALALLQMQDEYLALDQITAPLHKVPRKAHKGGRVPLDHDIWEDKKESELYDYQFDPRKVGFQDPETQRIARDQDGRELRKRRNRGGVEVTETVAGWDFGDRPEDGTKRHARQPKKFTAATVHPLKKKVRLGSPEQERRAAPAPAKAPGWRGTPLGAVANGTLSVSGHVREDGSYAPATAGRWVGHVPKRIRELRDESVVTVRTEGGSESSIKKGRPPGSKNLRVRSDKGVKKGPRRKTDSKKDEGDGEADEDEWEDAADEADEGANGEEEDVEAGWA